MELEFALSSGTMRGRRWGDPSAPLVVCVHGLTANLTAFAWLAEGLVAAGRQVVAFDCRGRGRSELTAPGSYGLAAHAREVLEIADRLEADCFDYVGWSMGAVIGMFVVRTAADRVRHLTLLDHAGPMDPEAVEVVRRVWRTSMPSSTILSSTWPRSASEA